MGSLGTLKGSLRQITVAGCCIIGSVVKVAGQDLHFSQWFNSPLMTNPANTGFIPDADYRLGANYRNQWSTVMSVPYQTMSVWGDAQVFRNRIENGWMGLGGAILKDDAGSSTLDLNRSIRIGGVSPDGGIFKPDFAGVQYRIISTNGSIRRD